MGLVRCFPKEINQQILDIAVQKGIDQPPELSSIHADFMGSTWQLRYGEVVGNALGLDPVFGALLNPSGGLVGSGNISVSPSDFFVPESTAYHSVFHDAAGFLENYLNQSPGYHYLGANESWKILPTTSPLAGQVAGQLWWIGQASKVRSAPGYQPPAQR